MNEWTEWTDPPERTNGSSLNESIKNPSGIVQESFKNPSEMWQETCCKNRSWNRLQKSLKKPPSRILLQQTLQKSFRNRSRYLQESLENPSGKWQETCFKNCSRNRLQKSLKKPPPRLFQRSSFNGRFKNRSRIAQETRRNPPGMRQEFCFKIRSRKGL